MWAVTVVEGGLEWREHPDPEPGAGELLVDVRGRREAVAVIKPPFVPSHVR